MSSIVFTVLNDLVSNGIIKDYALGGSVGFMVWTQPFATNDTDFFVTLPDQGGLLVSLSDVYSYAKQKGFLFDHEHIVIDGEPVQLIPSPSGLYDDAIATAVTKRLFGQPVRVMQPEYLVCTALSAGRLKDFAKIEKLLSEATIDLLLLRSLIKKFSLLPVWNRYIAAIGEENPDFLHLAQTKLKWRTQHANDDFAIKYCNLRKLRERSSTYLRYRGVLYKSDK